MKIVIDKEFYATEGPGASLTLYQIIPPSDKPRKVKGKEVVSKERHVPAGYYVDMEDLLKGLIRRKVHEMDVVVDLRGYLDTYKSTIDSIRLNLETAEWEEVKKKK